MCSISPDDVGVSHHLLGNSDWLMSRQKQPQLFQPMSKIMTVPLQQPWHHLHFVFMLPLSPIQSLILSCHQPYIAILHVHTMSSSILNWRNFGNTFGGHTGDHCPEEEVEDSCQSHLQPFFAILDTGESVAGVESGVSTGVGGATNETGRYSAEGGVGTTPMVKPWDKPGEELIITWVQTSGSSTAIRHRIQTSGGSWGTSMGWCKQVEGVAVSCQSGWTQRPPEAGMELLQHHQMKSQK